MIGSLTDLDNLLDDYKRLADDEIALSNPCVINYLQMLNVDLIMSRICPSLFVRNCTNACKAHDMIVLTLKEIDNELSTRYGSGLHNP